jgi:hypothetical protein
MIVEASGTGKKGDEAVRRGVADYLAVESHSVKWKGRATRRQARPLNGEWRMTNDFLRRLAPGVAVVKIGAWSKNFFTPACG